MKVQVRRGVFETNSSSTHSMCIAKEEVTVEEGTTVEFTFGEFGWAFEEYTDTNGKASYLYTAIHAIDNGQIEERIEFIRDCLDSHGVRYTMEEPVYHVNSRTNYRYLESGMIDHSYDTHDFVEDVCSDHSKLMSYLFSDRSFVLTGNDNSDHDVSINVDYECYRYYKGN